jgi:hypothetical protein
MKNWRRRNSCSYLLVGKVRTNLEAIGVQGSKQFFFRNDEFSLLKTSFKSSFLICNFLF